MNCIELEGITQNIDLDLNLTELWNFGYLDTVMRLKSRYARSNSFTVGKSQVGFVDGKGGGWLSVLSVAESCALIFILDSLSAARAGVVLDSVLCLFVIAMLVAYLTSK